MKKITVKASARTLLIAMTASAVYSGASYADATLDRILSTKTLKCGVQLDFPPAGYRTANGEIDGYDVAYCKDMAKALGVNAEIVETASPDRIPALVSNRIDISIASASITPARALTVAFSQPYVSYSNVVLTRKDSGIEKFDDLKGKKVGGVNGTTTEQQLRQIYKSQNWASAGGDFITYNSEPESYLALTQGKIDGLMLNNATAAALVQSGQFPTLAIKGQAPVPVDLTGMAVRKADTDLLRWVQVFVWDQVKSGRYAELYTKYFNSTDIPSLSVPGVDF
ncbi:transporter substrate-binding domain-containing protein [Pseudomonas putida]|uniref:Transporter substrate-binding domain-containing protein n=2 Tax=Pseudomonas TaxID=286 RepID=A0A7W2L5M1_PSEPU|nr:MULTISPECIES: transporter substrate-binding domain-containing protein [Pseudomonas]MBA6118815.1 transporter substrate-binding domain-containing protein [Pseudomonas putida]MBI6944868.1 transporter substrate-binding domain-containing protein [Pseudomonas putida]MBI6961187.1 transporter substrate-binding domain-containing protein [Pseudomonas putida]MCZ9637503.1 transporter substrate-binding domain-containing protein [Pseudomonas putida]MEC4879529.1 transporter substrate-binding domain-contai